MKNRVVITGMGAISPFGSGVKTLYRAFKNNISGITQIVSLKKIGGLRSLVAGLVPPIDATVISRKYRRSMSPMSVFAAMAAQEAMAQAKIKPEICTGGNMGVAMGSTVGSPVATEDFFSRFLNNAGLDGIRSTTFFKMMNHSPAMNLAQLYNITGRVLAPSVACSTGCQTIGLGFEMIGAGFQDVMLCGGTDEFHAIVVATFDIMNAASVKFNGRPHKTPRPFDIDRDGVVCAEGSGVLALETLTSAKKRKAKILAEIIGFATTADTGNIANPSAEAVADCMRRALESAGVKPDKIDYVNAHATGTRQGDIAEARAILSVFGSRVPVSSLKGHMGHTMAASGALELIAAIEMMHDNLVIPTLNLDAVDPACDGIRHVCYHENIDIHYLVKNNFALGGINSSIVLKRYDDNERKNY